MSSYRYIYSTKSKIYHRRGCKYVKMISEECKKEGVIKLLENKGYCKCKYCNNLDFKFKSEKHVIDQYCEDNNLIYKRDEGMLLVQSEISRWLIKYDYENDYFILYHGNRCPDDVSLKRLPFIDYHRQRTANTSKTIMGFIIYIRDHDDYRSNIIENIDNMPKNTKKQRSAYKKAKKKEKTYKVARVLQLLNSMEQQNKDYVSISIAGYGGK